MENKVWRQLQNVNTHRKNVWVQFWYFLFFLLLLWFSYEFFCSSKRPLKHHHNELYFISQTWWFFELFVTHIGCQAYFLKLFRYSLKFVFLKIFVQVLSQMFLFLNFERKTVAVFLVSKKRKSNDDDKHDHCQEKKETLNMCWGQKNIYIYILFIYGSISLVTASLKMFWIETEFYCHNNV